MREDIDQWLNELGLGQYAEAFARNDISFAVVGELSERDLRELGVTMGHRKILLRAIADYTARAAANVAEPPPASTPERRQLTVMFCDLVNSTGLAERYDPEVVKDVTAAFRRRCETEVKRFGGNVAGLRGDGLLVYFGYPEANEHDAERAVRAGLGIAKGVRELEALPGTPLECRVGIATGEVVVGDVVGSELTHERDVTGVVPNLAARLQQLAEPSTVLVSDVTRWLVGNLFEYSHLGTFSLHGFANQQSVWRVDGEALVDSRFAATHPAAELTPLVGREQELARLLRHWNLATRGQGQAVLLLGEPGIGKSRMTHSLVEAVLGTEPKLYRCFCVEHNKNTALFPITSLLERLARFERGDSPAAKLDKLEQLLNKAYGGSADVAPLYAALLSIPMEDRYPALNLTADVQKERTFAALESQPRKAAATRTVLLILEDMHWSDPTTKELVERVLQWLPEAAIMLLMTARPELAGDWAMSDKITTLPLQRLSHDKSLDLVTHVSRHVIPREIVWEIVAKSDGIPLYLEEITKTVLERRPFKNGDAPQQMPLEIKVPNTLHDSIAARLDKLPGAKRVAQVGATIGRQFSYELLAAVCALSKKEVLQALDDLIAADLLSASGTVPNAVYTFKHALLQDWAYENQLKSERSKLHTSIALILEKRFRDEVATQPQVLAHHYSKAGEYGKAIGYWQKAAKRSVDQAAYTEALKYLSHAFDHLDKVEDDRQRDTIELELCVARGLTLERTMGYGAPEIEQTYERARELCRKLGETVDMVPVLLGLYVFHLVRADQKTDLLLAHELARQCAQLSDDSGRLNYSIESCAALGFVLCYLGHLEEAREVLEKGVGLYELNWRSLEFGITAQDPGVSALALLGVVLWLLGRPDESLQALKKSFELADALGEPINHALACAHAAQLYQLRREPERAAEYAQKGIAVAAENGYRSWEAACSMHLGIAKAQLGESAYGLGLATKWLELWRAGGAELNRPYFLSGIAQGEFAAGRPDDAIGHLSEALAHAERTGEVYFVPLLRQIRGDYYAALPDAAADAAADLRRARESAKAQGARMFELRALRSLCGLRSAAGEKAERLAELARLVKELDAAGDTLDLRDAKALCG